MKSITTGDAAMRPNQGGFGSGEVSGFGGRIGFLTVLWHRAGPRLIKGETAEVFERECCAEDFQRLEQMGLPHLRALVSGILWQPAQGADRAGC